MTHIFVSMFHVLETQMFSFARYKITPDNLCEQRGIYVNVVRHWSSSSRPSSTCWASARPPRRHGAEQRETPRLSPSVTTTTMVWRSRRAGKGGKRAGAALASSCARSVTASSC